MQIEKYEDMNLLEMDVIREIGSIGTGNAATALSQLLREEIRMSIPEVAILGFDETIERLGNPEEIVTAVLVRMKGEIQGMMLLIMKMDFISAITQRLLSKEILDYAFLGNLEISAIEEAGNIIISSYINALSALTGVSISLSVPDIAVNMLGGILSVPMAEFGYTTDKLMMIDGKFFLNNKELENRLLLMPDIESLNFLMERLGVHNE
ncbi:chemotaxis protein CheC [Parasporobacterium paucivorans]|uniref:Chemotaxis protein CheC n=1 Tax=Parasporobacterium paucivorans DSM 15970 TaxID=1122934 RepID=A0A1M6I9Z9_9FIRM|nr:chemotaxis protein CheC [Parasporobacterium paucivorans]SHJ31319.1 chemotaxis protein CheC [Parasporobacterium paucivorans DSM 15970]